MSSRLRLVALALLAHACGGAIAESPPSAAVQKGQGMATQRSSHACSRDSTGSRQ
jgi:hypothetical protein